MKQSELCPHCGSFSNRGVSVDAVIVSDGKILLIRRRADPFKGFMALPGGYVEWDESVEEALVREVAEETGLDVQDSRLLGVYSSPQRHPKQCIDIAFHVTATGALEFGDDAIDGVWVDLAALPSDLAFDHARIIQDYIATISK